MRIGYSIKQALIQIWRNKGMAFAATLAITAMMLILGVFFVIIVNIDLFTEMLQSNYNEVELFLKDEVTPEEAETMIGTLETYGGVREAKFRTKEEAMDIMRQRWGENSYLLDSLGENPLPNSIVLSMDSMESANNLTEKVKALEGVEDIKYYKETVEKLGRVSNALRITSIAIIAFLLIVSIIIVSNTIKLTVMARAKEIEIMKYIGGTNWFIRGPFLVEGIILGTVASAVAALVTYLIYREVIVLVGRSFMTIMGSPLVPAEYMLNNLLIIFIALGVSIGACGSIISMRKFLNR